MSRARIRSWMLAGLCALASACGDDGAAPGVGTGDPDAGHDSGIDASQPMEAGVDDSSVLDATTDGHVEENTMPPPDDDAQTPTCAEDCDALSTECTVAVCNEVTLECDVSSRSNGTACGSQVLDNCGAPDQCRNGVCDPRDAPEDTPCGDQGVECHRDDACDGNGSCIDKGLLAIGSDCGDDASSECDAPDSCNAAGECAPNYADEDEPCGDQDELCHFDDACDGSGHCLDHGTWEAGTCPVGSTEHEGLCTCGRTGPITTCLPGPDVCVAGTCELGHEHYAPSGGTTDGTSCGSAANTECDDPDVCDDGFCATNVEPITTTCGSGASTACDGADHCDGFGNCSSNYADNDTVCDEAPGPCFAAPLCNGSGACLAGSATPGAACGDSTATACDGADVCDVLGNCDPNLFGPEVECGPSVNGPCDVPDVCNGAGGCTTRFADSGTVCGDDGLECENPDTCNASGACIDHGHVGFGEPCGDDSVTECDAADICDGAGSCSPSYETEGTDCGGAPGTCEEQDSCDDSGSCVDRGFSAGCDVSVSVSVFDRFASTPLSGVTIEIIGSNPLRSDVTDSNGVATLQMPVATDVMLRAYNTSTYWGAVHYERIAPGENPRAFYLYADAIIESLSASGVAPLSDTAGVAMINFATPSGAGGENASITPSCPPATCGPIVSETNGTVHAGNALLAGGLSDVGFINLSVASVSPSVAGNGSNVCTLVDSPASYPVFPHALTEIRASCSSD